MKPLMLQYVPYQGKLQVRNNTDLLQDEIYDK